MAHLTPAALVENLSWRTAIKSFDPARRIADGEWRALERAMILSPSSFGMQPWKFLVVADPAVRAALRLLALNQPQITDASHLVVFAARSTLDNADIDRHIQRIADVRRVPARSLDGFRSTILQSIRGRDAEHLREANARQVYLALGFFLSACAMVGIDACPIEGFDAAGFDGALGLPAMGYNAVVLAAAGYRTPSDPCSSQAKVRFADEHVVTRV